MEQYNYPQWSKNNATIRLYTSIYANLPQEFSHQINSVQGITIFFVQNKLAVVAISFCETRWLFRLLIWTCNGENIVVMSIRAYDHVHITEKWIDAQKFSAFKIPKYTKINVPNVAATLNSIWVVQSKNKQFLNVPEYLTSTHKL